MEFEDVYEDLQEYDLGQQIVDVSTKNIFWRAQKWRTAEISAPAEERRSDQPNSTSGSRNCQAAGGNRTIEADPAIAVYQHFRPLYDGQSGNAPQRFAHRESEIGDR